MIQKMKMFLLEAWARVTKDKNTLVIVGDVIGGSNPELTNKFYKDENGSVCWEADKDGKSILQPVSRQ